MPPKKIYQPRQRNVAAHILTPNGWVDGTFHIPETIGFPEYMNKEGEFDTLTAVTVGHYTRPISFFQLHRRHMIIVAPKAGRVEATYSLLAGVSEVRRIFCLLEGGVLLGNVQVVKDTRISDYFTHRKGFMVFTDCSLRRSRDGGEEAKEEIIHAALVNSSAIIGVSDVLP